MSHYVGLAASAMHRVTAGMCLWLLISGGMLRTAWAGPAITVVSMIFPRAHQAITISGSGFGRFRPYTGDSPFIRLRDLSARWDAGNSRDRPPDRVVLEVLSWTDSRIVLGGFRGAYGRRRWRLSPGDRLLVQVWNPQTRAGPARYETTIAAAASIADPKRSPPQMIAAGRSGQKREALSPQSISR